MNLGETGGKAKLSIYYNYHFPGICAKYSIAGTYTMEMKGYKIIHSNCSQWSFKWKTF